LDEIGDFRLSYSPSFFASCVSAQRRGLPFFYILYSIEYTLSYGGVSVARPKSEDKRNAILDAATRVFAERGLTAAPTSEISKEAGVAEGTLFTYFKTKDDLMNALYREIKLELADAMMSDSLGSRMFVPGCNMFGIVT